MLCTLCTCKLHVNCWCCRVREITPISQFRLLSSFHSNTAKHGIFDNKTLSITYTTTNFLQHIEFQGILLFQTSGRSKALIDWSLIYTLNRRGHLWVNACNYKHISRINRRARQIGDLIWFPSWDINPLKLTAHCACQT